MISIVVPTLGRPSLATLLHAIAGQLGPGEPGDGQPGDGQARNDPNDRPAVELLLVDDRGTRDTPLPVPATLTPYPGVLRGRGAGPAAARNLGWRAARHRWVVFLDDDVVPAPDWWDRLVADLDVPPWIGGVQGRVHVPLPAGHRPTDWERATAGLVAGRWITADMAYRRNVLATVGGFDERFPRAYREDAELAHRARLAGWHLVRGTRSVSHPVRPESRWVSLRNQRGNADDALLRRLYGAGWRRELELPTGRRHRHAAVTAAAAVAATAAGMGLAASAGARPVRRWRRNALIATALAAAGGWLAGTARFAWERIAPGPRDPGEVGTMLVTSVLIPPLAVGHWLRGWWRSRAETRAPVSGPVAAPVAGPPLDPFPVPGQADATIRGKGAVGRGTCPRPTCCGVGAGRPCSCRTWTGAPRRPPSPPPGPAAGPYRRKVS